MNALIPTLLIGFFAIPVLAGDDDLLEMVGEKTDLVLHFPNTQTTRENWEKSSLKEIYNNNEIKPYVEEVFEDLFAFEDLEDEDLAEDLREGLTELYQQSSGEVLIALNIPSTTDELVEQFEKADEGSSADQAKLMFGHFGILILAEVEKNEAAFEKAARRTLDTFLEVSEDIEESDDAEHSIVEKEIQGVDVTAFHTEESGIAMDIGTYGVVGQTAFLSMGNFKVADTIKNIRNGHSASLGKSDFVADHPADFQLIGDVSDFVSGIKVILKKGFEDLGTLDQFQINLDGGWEALGLDRLRRCSFALDLSKPDIVFTSKMDMPTSGVVSYLMPAEPINSPSKFAHKGILSVYQSNYDFPGLYDEIMKAVKTISPMGPMAIGMQLGEIEKQLGVKIREDLLATLAPGMQILEFKNNSGIDDYENMGLILGLKDKAKFEGSLRTIAGAMEIEINKEDFLDHTIYNLPLDPLGDGVVLSYSFDGDDLFLGMKSGGAVKEIIKQISNPRDTIWDSGLFDDHPDLLKPNPVVLDLSDFGEELTLLLETFQDFFDEDDDVIDFNNIKIPFDYTLSATWLKNGISDTKAVILAK